ncbi:MAG: glycogen debranching protein GlgX [Spirochaetota bacterium]
MSPQPSAPASEIRKEAGNPLQLGATVALSGAGEEGVNFAIFSRHATSLRLCLYDKPKASRPFLEIPLEPASHKTGDIWHCFLSGPGIGKDSLYLWRAEGPFDPSKGHRFDPRLPLLDPYAKALTDGSWDLASKEPDDSHFPKCVVVEDDFDWMGDAPLNYPLKDCVIYETHVRGLTKRHPRVAHPGTYRGVAEMIGYFKDLGVTSLELLPIHEFDPSERFRRNPSTGAVLSNYWGYSPLAFFAPKATYAYVDGEDHPDKDPARQVREFKSMVRELHAAGIEVILDVVFNHTAEGSELGPTLSFRGLDNSIYYILDEDKGKYRNYSGCGNTLNCNHPVMRALIMDCLRYWVVHMHVDGFRFDLGSILGRDASGALLENPPVIEAIAEDPILRQTKIIAEAWDAGGAYQVGSFPGGRWAEWNDKYRDDVRRFWKGEKGSAVHLATRITGSSDLYLRDGRKPFHSINFVTAHDGFTLNDLVSYSRKHNRANGEENRDGSDANWSMNFGEEGPSEDPAVEARRNRQAKNFLATLLLSVGTPMLLGGDEFRRSQGGNNNAYCQDNEISWYDWELLERHGGLRRFCAELVRLRKTHPVFRRPEFYTGLDNDANDVPDITWFDEKGQNPDWPSLHHTLAAMMDGSKAESHGESADDDFYILFNASHHSLSFSIPSHPRGSPWRKMLDTSAPSPRDIVIEAPFLGMVENNTCLIAPRSLVLLVAPRSLPAL